jgi:hypothetical protein
MIASAFVTLIVTAAVLIVRRMTKQRSAIKSFGPIPECQQLRNDPIRTRINAFLYKFIQKPNGKYKMDGIYREHRNIIVETIE